MILSQSHNVESIISDHYCMEFLFVTWMHWKGVTWLNSNWYVYSILVSAISSYNKNLNLTVRLDIVIWTSIDTWHRHNGRLRFVYIWNIFLSFNLKCKIFVRTFYYRKSSMLMADTKLFRLHDIEKKHEFLVSVPYVQKLNE